MPQSKPLQFQMPAEWEPQAATWLSWPTNVDTWSQNLKMAQIEFTRFVHAIAKFQPVRLMAGSGEAFDQCHKSVLPKKSKLLTPHQLQNIRLLPFETNDAWARDYAPTFVHRCDGRLTSIDFNYNAWGEKYPPFDADQAIASQVAQYLNISNVAVDVFLEGGAIETNGNGILLTTESCLLNPNRNPGIGKHVLESILKKHLGVQQIIWLPGNAIAGDDTDGHIDQLARFTDATTIVYAWTDDANDPQYAGLKSNLEQLHHWLIQTNQSFDLIPLPLPAPIHYCDLRIPASYCNFLIINGAVIVPQFGDQAADQHAVETLCGLFKHREIIPLPSRELSVGLGSFHCLSQQQPLPTATASQGL